MKVTLEKYKTELKALEKRMVKAEAFAKKLHVFAEKILENKWTGEEEWVSYGTSYKKLYCAWGINRGLWTQTNGRTLGYNSEKYNGYLFCIYINTLSLYDDHARFGLDEIVKNIPLVKYDEHNTNFYATDDQITALLEALHEWYLSACEKVKEHKNKKRQEQLEAELAKLKGDAA